MLSWEQLMELDTNYMTSIIPRAPWVAAEYDHNMSKPEFKQSVISMIIEGLSGSDYDYWLRPNDYPYLMPDGVQHVILWFKAGRFDSMQDAKQTLIRQHGIDPEQIVVSCNAHNLKSIPEIDHYHVFIKTK